MSVLDRIRDSFKYLDKNGLKHVIDKTERIFRYSTMPAASANFVTNIVQYIGATNANYTNGFFYRSVLNGAVYEWQQVSIQPNEDIPHWSGTHAQYDADPSAVPVGAYITFIDDADTNYESGKYSINEVRTGKTWIDGKPIYRKTFVINLGTVTDNAWTNVYTPTGVSNINKVTSITGTVEYPIGCVPVCFSVDADGTTPPVNAVFAWYLNNTHPDHANNIVIHACGARYNNKDAYITIEYTKSTD